ncbi:MAG: Holliday junction branch migration protein RuvA [Bacteroidales bacterium]|nr:Holliday junction branch migration protein RuvA [Bacteroidales bacterium]
MYEFIQGKLTDINPAYVVVEVGGIGFLLHISLNTYSNISGKTECRLYAHQVIREDAQLLFGFSDQEERELFRLLISVSGIGPNTARILLSSITPAELRQVIVTGQAGVLKSVKGIGEKSAQRIIVDLKDKIDKGAAWVQKVDISHNTIREQSLSGLIVLGFPRKVAEKAVDEVIQGHAKQTDSELHSGPISVEYIIKEALKRL